MSQSRKHSIMETVVNTAVGYGINFAANMTVLPLFGYHITATDNLVLGVVYTGISVVRSYCMRRAFNSWHVQQARAA